ncbi:hypothetical protein AWV79_24225 [Cupriavidus sp. UYMMa02A]|nr:hypothetical protein AWV79_24225 [Cupriavidus sp. UYMMa02A]
MCAHTDAKYIKKPRLWPLLAIREAIFLTDTQQASEVQSGKRSDNGRVRKLSTAGGGMDYGVSASRGSPPGQAITLASSIGGLESQAGSKLISPDIEHSRLGFR